MKRLLSLILVLISSISLAYAAVNLNTATVDELDGVKGIGPSKAKAIVDHRSKNGPFKSVDDLKGVKGFGEKSVARLRGELTVGEGGLHLDLHEDPQQIHLPATGAAETDQFLIQRIIHILALTKRLLSLAPDLALQLHAIHKQTGDTDLLFTDSSRRLGDMPHHGESGMKEQRLFGTSRHPAKTEPLLASFADVIGMANPQPEQGANPVPQPKAE